MITSMEIFCDRCKINTHGEWHEKCFEENSFIVCSECLEKLKDYKSVKDLPKGDRKAINKERAWYEN